RAAGRAVLRAPAAEEHRARAVRRPARRPGDRSGPGAWPWDVRRARDADGADLPLDRGRLPALPAARSRPGRARRRREPEPDAAHLAGRGAGTGGAARPRRLWAAVERARGDLLRGPRLSGAQW